jgi:hypothetical protein
MSSSKQNKNSHRRVRNQASNTDLAISNSLHSAASGDIVSVPRDTTRRTPSFNLVERPPVSFMSKIVWLQESFETTLLISASGAVAELNLAPTLGSFPAASSMSGLFDQWCIYAFKIRAVLDQIAQSDATSLSYGRILTALDYDSTTNLGTEAAMMRYGTVQVCELDRTKSYERYVKPCVAGVTGLSNSTSASGLTTQRSWLNSVYTAVPNFGIRIMTVGNQNISSNYILVTTTAVIGLRNNI